MSSPAATHQRSCICRPARYLTATLGLACLLVTSGSTAGTIRLSSSPAEDTITIDGDRNDWEGRPVLPLEDSLGYIAVSHDRDTLYLMYRFRDENLARRLLARGVLLWLNGDGKTSRKHEQYGIRYGGSRVIAEHLGAPEAQPPDERERQGPPGGDPGRHGPPGGSGPGLRRAPEPTRSMRPEPGSLTIIRNGYKETLTEVTSETDRPRVASSVHDDIFIYELSIPIAELGGKIAGQPPSKPRSVALGIEIGGLTEAEQELLKGVRAVDHTSGGAAPMPGSGPPMGGGPGGFRAGRGPSNERKLFKPKITWLKISLEPLS